MGELRESGKTSISLIGLRVAERPHDLLLEAVQKEAAPEYEVFGEIARTPDGGILYLARDRMDKGLVILRLMPAGGMGEEYSLELVKQLDASVPAPLGNCPRCAAPLRQWGRYCSMCGTDLWSDPELTGEYSREELLEAVKETASGKYEVLGEMPRAEGGGFVYFGRDLETGRITALRLLQESQGEYSLGKTGLLRRAASSVSPPKPAPQRPQPKPVRPAPPPPPAQELLELDSLLLEPRQPIVRHEKKPPRPVQRPMPAPPPRPPVTTLGEFLALPIVQLIIALGLAVVLVSVCTVVTT